MTIFWIFWLARLPLSCHSLRLASIYPSSCVMAEGVRDGFGVGHLASLQPFAIRLEPDMAAASRITHNPEGTDSL